MNRERLFALVDRRACLDFVARMVRHRSYSNTQGESELSRFMARSMEELGLETTLQEVEPGRVQALGTLKGEGGVCDPGGRYNTMPDERVDIPDYLDMVRIDLLTILDICAPV